jgi:hypothetical protein
VVLPHAAWRARGYSEREAASGDPKPRVIGFPYHAELDLQEEFLARVTVIAYQALLRQGLQRPFLEVELELWQQIRAAYRDRETWSDLVAEVA